MIGAIILGIVAGFAGRLLMPGRDPMGFLATVLLGLAGAIVGVMILLGAFRLFIAHGSHTSQTSQTSHTKHA
jgi:uncharacterized membrane protein YeaQ/YmgE (transglycosylase-associated protein family)